MPGNYKDVIAVLNEELYTNANSRAALSLLAYAYCSVQNFADACQCYEQLVHLYPDARNYLLNLAKCYYQTGDYEKSLKCIVRYTEKYKVQTSIDIHNRKLIIRFGGI